MTIQIGTSGFSYEDWAQKFYPAELPKTKWLEYYAQNFNTVELNSPFYRLPSEKSFQKWHKETPAGFHFAVKGNRYLTHVKRLKNSEDSINLFFKRALNLKEKLDVVLWQLPPNFKANAERLEKFLFEAKRFKICQAIEFRDQSWFKEPIYKILKKYNVSAVIADSPLLPKIEILTADFIYIRFHGAKILYSSNYSDKELQEWAYKIKAWSKNRDVFIYFNNDYNAYAVKNALYLKQLLEK
ncbi:MAG: DUF72 domain-containing protein [Patescibacteria group bacterium]|nr:DUF72 domain-containing protein [Patescibacteria group bacterium]